VEGEAGELSREDGLDHCRFGMVSGDLRKHLLDKLNGYAAPQQLKPEAAAVAFAIAYRCLGPLQGKAGIVQVAKPAQSADNVVNNAGREFLSRQLLPQLRFAVATARQDSQGRGEGAT
jgi:hypothetical protein